MRNIKGTLLSWKERVQVKDKKTDERIALTGKGKYVVKVMITYL